MSLSNMEGAGAPTRKHAECPYRRLCDLEGIGPKIATRIVRHYNKAWNSYTKYSADEEDLGLFTLGSAYGDSGVKAPGELSEWDICVCIQAKPYSLTAVRGVAFGKADTIAQRNFGGHRDAPDRHRAGNRFIAGRKGAMPLWQYRRERQKLELRDDEHEFAGVIVEQGAVWLPAELEAETFLAQFFESVAEREPSGIVRAVGGTLRGEALNAEQLSAVSLALSGVRAMALTGGAGTGKTRTLAAVGKAAAAHGLKMRVMAFSGKAAMRAEEAMREGGALGVECSTIHRALGIQGTYRADTGVLGEEIVVLDEASMIPNWLMAAVVKALKPGATLMLVGDPNQLPPIGYGTPFQDFLALGLPHIHLTQNYRQANQQSIFKLAEAIREQEPELYEPAASGVQAHFQIDPENEQLFDGIIRACAPLGLHEWQAVTWTNAIQQALNLHIQKLMNPHGQRLFDYPCWDLKEGSFTPRADVRVGDKVMVTDNDYDYEVFNGQMGVITKVTFRTLTLDLGHRILEMDVADARDLLQLGYCCTVHKSQGSGWEAVIVYQPFEVKFQPRRFYYTSVTRAKNQVYLVTPMSEFEFWRNACQSDNDPESTLLGRLRLPPAA